MILRWVIALVVAGIFFMYWGRSGAAERAYEIVLFERPMPNDAPDRPRIYIISQPFATKDDCLQMLRSVRIKAPNARAKCLPKED